MKYLDSRVYDTKYKNLKSYYEIKITYIFFLIFIY